VFSVPPAFETGNHWLCPIRPGPSDPAWAIRSDLGHPIRPGPQRLHALKTENHSSLSTASTGPDGKRAIVPMALRVQGLTTLIHCDGLITLMHTDDIDIDSDARRPRSLQPEP
jgi:hypothetical protein